MRESFMICCLKDLIKAPCSCLIKEKKLIYNYRRELIDELFKYFILSFLLLLF